MTATRSAPLPDALGAPPVGAAASPPLPGGTVHGLPADLAAALSGDEAAEAAWRDITPLARNEFVCWIEDAKKAATRERRIAIAGDKLRRGERRPCCWAGCPHRQRTGRA